MRILIDVGHPAHVHLFRNFISAMEANGHQVYITTKKVKSIVDLLNIYQLDYIPVVRKPDSLLLKYVYQLYSVLKLFYISKKYKMDIGLGVSMTLPLVSMFSNMKCLGFDDDDIKVTPIFAKFIGMSDSIITPESLSFEKRGEHHLFYKGFHELAYLHPNRFSPDPFVLQELGIKNGERFFIMRFNRFKAHHDKGMRGVSLEQKLLLVETLKKHGRILITTEMDIEPELKKYQLKLSPEKIHSLIYYASMFIGDSQTMTSEAALLGTPAIKCNSFAGNLSIPNEIEHKYGLCYSFFARKL